ADVALAGACAKERVVGADGVLPASTSAKKRVAVGGVGHARVPSKKGVVNATDVGSTREKPKEGVVAAVVVVLARTPAKKRVGAGGFGQAGAGAKESVVSARSIQPRARAHIGVIASRGVGKARAVADKRVVLPAIVL